MNRPARQASVPQNPPQSGAPVSLWDKPDQLSASALPSEWRDVPPDLARNFKQYLNSTPKQ